MELYFNKMSIKWITQVPNHGKYDSLFGQLHWIHLEWHLHWQYIYIFFSWSEHKNFFFFEYLDWHFGSFHFQEVFLIWQLTLCQTVLKEGKPACVFVCWLSLSVHVTVELLSHWTDTYLVLPIHHHNCSTAGCDWALLCYVPKSSGDWNLLSDAVSHTV